MIYFVNRHSPLKEIPVFHWGDIDAGGVRIAAHLEDAFDVPIILQQINSALARKLGSPLTSRKGLAQLLGGAVTSVYYRPGFRVTRQWHSSRLSLILALPHWNQATKAGRRIATRRRTYRNHRMLAIASNLLRCGSLRYIGAVRSLLA